MKEGTDSSQGVPQIVSNINACGAIADAVRTTLGPRGMDKLIVDDKGKFTFLISSHLLGTKAEFLFVLHLCYVQRKIFKLH